MKLQKTILSFVVAGAAALSAVPGMAAPTFYVGTNTLGDTSLNDIEIINRENDLEVSADLREFKGEAGSLLFQLPQHLVRLRELLSAEQQPDEA